MTGSRLQQKFSDFQSALATLEKGLAMAKDELDRDGVIQRFEFTYELAWKTMKIWLADRGVRAGNPRDVFAAALENDLIKNGNLWPELYESRNLTSHTYKESTAIEVFEEIKTKALSAFKEFVEEMKKHV